jgi:hypothetical protein
MGFLKKIVKKVKKGIKKIGSGVKKVFKKLSKSKLLKTIAIVGAALVTGGAAVGAFGGSLASSTIGQALIASKNFIMGIPGVSFVAKPFEYAGTMLGTGAGRVTDFLGVTTEAGRLGPGYAQELALSTTAAPAGEINMGAMDFAGGSGTSMQFNPVTGSYEMVQAPFMPGSNTFPVGATTQGAVTEEMRKQIASRYITDPLSDEMKKAVADTVLSESTTNTASRFAQGSTLGDIARSVGTNVLTGAAMQYIQGEPDPVGAVGYGLGEEKGINLTPLEVAYAQSGINMKDIYNNLTFGTADPGFLASNLYQQPTVGVA